MNSDLYNHPFYYDFAFGWDQTEEIKGLEQIWTRFFPGRVSSILEPACGSGRVLVALAKKGYRALGYDINNSMVEFAREKIRKEGVEDRVKIIEGDMVDFHSEEKFEIALNLINSLGYLTDFEQVVSHLQSTASCLVEGGVYIPQISLRIREEELPKQQTWIEKDEEVWIETTWQVLREDPQKDLSYHRCIMKIREKGIEGRLEEDHCMRSWTFPAFQKAVADSGCWELKAVYNERFKEIEMHPEMDGSLGNLYMVLKKRTG